MAGPRLHSTARNRTASSRLTRRARRPRRPARPTRRSSNGSPGTTARESPAAEPSHRLPGCASTPRNRQWLRRLRKRLANREHMRRVRKARKLCCIGVDPTPRCRCRHLQADGARRVAALHPTAPGADWWLMWLPTEDEKVNALTRAGIARDVLPRRLYQGAVGGQYRYFPRKLPVGLDGWRATFVFVQAEDETASAVRTWGSQHAALWANLMAADRAVEVIVVGREPERLAAGERVLDTSTPPESVTMAHEGAAAEMPRSRKRSRWATRPPRRSYDGLNPALQRTRILNAACAGSRRSTAAITTGRTWRSTRVPSDLFPAMTPAKTVRDYTRSAVPAVQVGQTADTPAFAVDCIELRHEHQTRTHDRDDRAGSRRL